MADTNFAQFAARGNPWVTSKTWDHELRDAGNPRCGTSRRNSAIEFVATPNSHNMRFPEPETVSVAKARSGPSSTAKVLSARNRLREIRRVPETVSRSVEIHVAEPEPASVRETRMRRSSKIAYYANFVNPKFLNLKLVAPIVFRNYSEIIDLFGSVETYLKGEYQ